MKTTIKWNADLFGVEIQTKDQHFVIDANPSMVMSWRDAVRYFEGHKEWELPTTDQLEIVSAYISTINDLIKKNRGYWMQGWHWTSDEYDEFFAWRVYMDGGDTHNGSKYGSNYVRAVSDLKVK